MSDQFRLYNTLSRQVEEFVPINAGQVGLYSCGPTVYSYAHIGNFRAYLFADLLRRTLTACGYQVEHVMNITDVGHLTDDGDCGEDKLEVGARREGLDAWAVAKKYTDAFFLDAAKLNILRPSVVCKATDYIPEQIQMVKTLEDKGYAYQTSDGVYFDTSRFDDYCKLGKLDVDGMQEGHRVDIGEKRHKTDFALWKLSKAEEHRQMEWDAPWGRGFPGWHIECSAMATRFLGEQFDIHTGGVDHITIHHTNEIAQSECASGKRPFVRYWMHGEFLVIDDAAKMSKSSGNVLTISSLAEQGYDPMAFRLLVLQSHYRKQLRFNLEILAAAQRGYERIHSQALKLKAQAGAPAVHLSPKATASLKAFHDAMANDLASPQALAVLHGVLEDQALSAAERFFVLSNMDQVLGLELFSEAAAKSDIPAAMQTLLDQRNQARKEKNWGEADRLRQAITTAGYEILDNPAGSSLKRKL